MPEGLWWHCCELGQEEQLGSLYGLRREFEEHWQSRRQQERRRRQRLVLSLAIDER